MKEDFFQQIVAELVESQERAIRVIAAAAADAIGNHEHFADAMTFHAQRLGLGPDGPMASEWIAKAIADVRQAKT